MQFHVRKLLTVITEAALERELLAELESLGAGGYTVTDARGRGSHGTRSSAWAHGTNIRVEIVCDAAQAAHIAARLRERYFEHYAMVVYMADVEVMRPEKFSGATGAD